MLQHTNYNIYEQTVKSHEAQYHKQQSYNPQILSIL